MHGFHPSPAPGAPSAADSDHVLADQLAPIDAELQAAGLIRSAHRKGAEDVPPHLAPDRISNQFLAEKKSQDQLRPPAAQVAEAPNGVSFIPVPAWNALPWLWHGFSTRLGGVSTAYTPDSAPGELNLGFTADDPRENVLRNRRLFAEAVTGNADTPLAMLRQIHSAALVVTGGSTPAACKGDGIMTVQPGVLIGVQTADCVPVLVADTRRKAVAAFHAGWRGTIKRIVENGIGRMRLEFGSDPQDLVAAIGPAIGPCCYSVGEEVLAEFESQFAYAPELFHAVRAPGQPGHNLHVDLIEANRRQLLAAGLAPDSISVAGGCTACQPQTFFSHRKARGRTGRMLSVIGIRPD